jgi:hypothetical protein
MAKGAYSANAIRAQKADGREKPFDWDLKRWDARLREAGSSSPFRLEGYQGTIESAGEGLRADREHAMLCVAYETLGRGELAALEVKDIDFHPNGSGQALIRRGKTDAEG